MPAQLCLTFCDLVECSLSVEFSRQELEWVAIFCSRDLTDPGIDPAFPALACILYHCATWESPSLSMDGNI